VKNINQHINNQNEIIKFLNFVDIVENENTLLNCETLISYLKFRQFAKKLENILKIQLHNLIIKMKSKI
jgi:hypothetical protein